jgi:enoyl-[acyl-carrier-protein] reductase (NADH)
MDDVWLKELITQLNNKIDKLDQQLKTMDERHIENSESLREHILRTEINEENIALLREEFKPVKKHVENVSFLLKSIGFLATVVGLTSGLLKLVSLL